MQKLILFFLMFALLPSEASDEKGLTGNFTTQQISATVVNESKESLIKSSQRKKTGTKKQVFTGYMFDMK